MRTIEEAIERFNLIGSAGSEEDNTACVMTAVSWVAGEAWTDHPQCAHRLLSSAAIAGNDYKDTTPEQRAALLRAGEHGLLDTWWVPDSVVVLALASAGKDATPFRRAFVAVNYVADWKIKKPRAVLSGAVLSGAVLRGAVLSDADLSDAVLSDAVLSDAVLRGAVLSDADLSDADLRDADLRGAVLRGAVLSDADLSDADLRDADLSGADLRGAVGNEWTLLPTGWKVNSEGLIVPEQS